MLSFLTFLSSRFSNEQPVRDLLRCGDTRVNPSSVDISDSLRFIGFGHCFSHQLPRCRASICCRADAAANAAQNEDTDARRPGQLYGLDVQLRGHVQPADLVPNRHVDQR